MFDNVKFYKMKLLTDVQMMMNEVRMMLRKRTLEGRLEGAILKKAKSQKGEQS
jgi:hypothetical protein